MIGTDLNLTMPSTAMTYSAMVAQCAINFQAIEDSIADKATPAGLDITSNLSIQGNHLTNVGGLILASGNPPAVAGSVYYDGTNFFMLTAAGEVRITDGDSLNLSAIGAFSGDFGTSDESAYYDLASEEFRFRSSATTYADVKADDLVLMEPGASPVDSVRITAQAMSASYTLTLPAAPPSATSFLTMDSSGNVVAGTNTRTVRFSMLNARDVAGAHANSNDGRWTLGNSTGALQIPLSLPDGATITAFKAYAYKISDSSNTLTATLLYVLPGSAAATVTSASNNSNAPGSVVTLSSTGLSHTVPTDARAYWAQIAQSDSTPSANDQVGTIEVTYTYST